MSAVGSAITRAAVGSVPARLEIAWTASARSLGDAVGYASAALLVELRWDVGSPGPGASIRATCVRAGHTTEVPLPASACIDLTRGRRWTHVAVSTDEGVSLLAATFERGRLAYCTSGIPALAGLRGGTYDAPTGILELYCEA